MPSSPAVPEVHQVSKWLVKPSSPSPSAAVHLTPWDLGMLSVNYIQKGLLFANLPTSLTTEHLIHHLKSSLSAALRHFYPLAGRLSTTQQPTGISVSIACTDEGAEFIHAVAENLTVADVLAPLSDVPAIVRSFFPLEGAVNHDGHTLPLLNIQLTELADGAFLACCFNHVIGDGTAYWHFFNAWAEIARTGERDIISRPPVLDRWFIDGVGHPPFILRDQFIERFAPPLLREKNFHFSPESIAALKARANKEHLASMISSSNTIEIEISSFQALSALMWRSITRARRLPDEQKTGCRLAIQNRARLQPPLSPDYFGNSIYAISETMTAGQVMAGGLGAAAFALNRRVAAHNDGVIREGLRVWHASPVVYGLSMFDVHSVLMGSSPRFDMYGCDFGWGKAMALRSGSANKFDGKVSSFPGREGRGSVDLEVCLKPEYMRALELDEEFMAAVSSPLDAQNEVGRSSLDHPGGSSRAWFAGKQVGSDRILRDRFLINGDPERHFPSPESYREGNTNFHSRRWDNEEQVLDQVLGPKFSDQRLVGRVPTY